MLKEKKYSGVIVPMVTPVTEDGTIDQDAVTRITKYLITHNAAPFILGTTGESASIPEEYKADFVKNVVRSTASQILTYAAVSGNCLKTSIEAAKRYFDLGIDVVVAHPPGFYPLTDNHLQKYYETLIENIPGPLIVYNIPLVTRISIPLDVVEKLSQHRRIVGLKDSEQDKARHDEAIDRWADRDDFSHLIGWATISADGLLLGSDGLVPSTGNLFPQLYVNLYNAARENDVETARRLQNETDEISRVYQKDFLICDSLAALKVMMHEAGLCQLHVLPPLQRINSEREVAIRKKTVELLQKYNAKLSGI